MNQNDWNTLGNTPIPRLQPESSNATDSGSYLKTPSPSHRKKSPNHRLKMSDIKKYEANDSTSSKLGDLKDRIDNLITRNKQAIHNLEIYTRRQ